MLSDDTMPSSGPDSGEARREGAGDEVIGALYTRPSSPPDRLAKVIGRKGG